MLSLTIAAASPNLPPRRRCSVKIVNDNVCLSGLEGGQVESAEVCGAQGASADSGGFRLS